MAPDAVRGAAGDDSGEMFLKSVLKVGPFPRAAPRPSLHVFLAIKLWPQDIAVREPQTSAKALCVPSSPGRCDEEVFLPFLSVYSPTRGNQQGEGKPGRARGMFAGAELGKVWSETWLGARRWWEDLQFPLLAPVTK